MIIEKKQETNDITISCLFVWQFLMHSMICVSGQPGMKIWSLVKEIETIILAAFSSFFSTFSFSNCSNITFPSISKNYSPKIAKIKAVMTFWQMVRFKNRRQENIANFLEIFDPAVLLWHCCTLRNWPPKLINICSGVDSIKIRTVLSDPLKTVLGKHWSPCKSWYL